MQTGHVGFKEGMYMASGDEVHITIKGKGGHAAMPHALTDTVLIASQVIVNLQQIASRFVPAGIPVVLSFGKIVADGTPEQLRQKAQGNETLRVGIEGGEKNEVFEALKKLSPVSVVDFDDEAENVFIVESKPGMASAKAIFDMCVEKGWYLTRLTPMEKNLEDVFRELTN